MLNKFPLWKNILIILVIIVGIIYALPNLYGDDPAVQVSGNNSSAIITQDQIQQIKQVLQENHITYKALDANKNSVLLRFNSTDTQFIAQSVIRPIFDQNYTVAVNLAATTPAWLQALGAHPMKLGLDLRGGIHFLLSVDVQGVVAKRLDGLVKSMMDDLRNYQIRYVAIDRNAQNQIILQFREISQLQQALNILPKDFPHLIFRDKASLLQIIAIPEPAFLETTRQNIIDQTATTLRNRINELGISEPIVQQQGLDRISVDLPGVQDSARAKQILGGTATLEFHLVSTSADPQTVLQTGVAPPGTRIYKMEDGSPILLDTQVVLAGSSITSAVSSFDQNGTPTVEITLGGGGEAYFTKVTRDNIHSRMAIVYVETQTVDQFQNVGKTKIHKKIERVISAPEIQSALGNQFQITGLTDPIEARNLALLLRAGAMPANVDIVQERTVGPSLGQENIRMGLLSVQAAFVLIVLFMACYYSLFGLFADFALFLNLILIVAIMSILGMTLTMPGIAGIVLTVGMAVDANVLIFERIREELRNNSPPQAAIHAGFERAFATIVDANVSTLIVALVLFGIGTGAVQGFAVTLTVGLLTSMFSAITFTRALVNWVYGGKTIKHLRLGMRVKG